MKDPLNVIRVVTSGIETSTEAVVDCCPDAASSTRSVDIMA